ncbi:AAA family ATPase [Cyclobacterium xiamenense]|jgi:predicted kinase|uniref:AAA family ATPase n=1 Tax=Cyclobacterium xiamenense TaxID=1297121 RepID=UPI0035D0A568
MVVLVMGLPGSGKSFFARRLAKEVRMVYLSSDAMRIEMNLRGKYAPADRQRVYAALEKSVELALSRGDAVVVDATFQHRANRLAFARISEKYQQLLACIQVTATEAVVKRRLSKGREESEADFAVHQKLKANFDPIDQPHLTIYSEDGQIDAMINKAREYLNQAHEN